MLFDRRSPTFLFITAAFVIVHPSCSTFALRFQRQCSSSPPSPPSNYELLVSSSEGGEATASVTISRYRTLREEWAHAAEVRRRAAMADARPIPDSAVTNATSAHPKERRRWEARGWDLLGRGSVGVVMLAGGLGTRSGMQSPKGTLSLSMPSGRSLFHMHADQLRALARGRGSGTSGEDCEAGQRVYTYIPVGVIYGARAHPNNVFDLGTSR